MTPIPSHPDVVIVGAGAAGIGAGLELLRRGIPFAILEAKERVGGRACSDTSSLGHLWDHGCHWLHSASENVLRRVADRLGHAYRITPADSRYCAFINGQWHREAWETAYPFARLADVAARGLSEDIAASAVLDPADPLYPLVRHWCQLMYSVDPERISTRDSHNYRDTHENYPVEAGYGALVAKMAAQLPIRLQTPVSAIDLTGPGVIVSSPAGTLRTKAVILAVPARMLERERIVVTPQLPVALQEAFHDVPMGYYEKVAFAFDGLVLDQSHGAFADIFDPQAANGRPCNVEVHPFDRPIAISHFGGDGIERAKPADLIALAESAIARAFGADACRRITRRAVSNWTSDPFINGAYSCAAPGRAALRERFADPVHGRLCLAGEHTHTRFHATANGAYETGLRAARQAALALGLPEEAEEAGWLP